ncbi:MAG: hypothetical protein WAU39_13135 [Polyangiales bacterium]
MLLPLASIAFGAQHRSILMDVTASRAALHRQHATPVPPGSFEPRNHFYARVLNAQIHPLVSFFLRMSKRRIVNRYCHLNPRVDPDALEEVLSYSPKYFQWAGADLFCTTTAAGNRRLVVLETNSCPSGNKSMPIPSDDDEQAGYRKLIETAFLPLIARRKPASGGLAVLFDKNHMEASGYAAVIADLTGEHVFLTPFPDEIGNPPARFTDGLLEVRDAEGRWRPMRAAFRYVTQKPWNRIPIRTRTRILNPVVTCLSGGRNKLVAMKAYELYNAELEASGLQIRTPQTIGDVAKQEVPLWVRRFGGQAVVKVPYSNAGQGVFTIVNERELDRFMDMEHPYDRFVVQSLIGNYVWSSVERAGRFYHVGTIPDRHGDIYVADLRVMVCGGATGFRPLAVYARRSRKPLPAVLEEGESSWEVLGTNLSERQPDGTWTASTDRLLLMDRRDFNVVGIGIDDLIEAYIQSVLAAIAIDKMTAMLLTQKGELRRGLFRSLDDDPALFEEIRQGAKGAKAIVPDGPKA